AFLPLHQPPAPQENPARDAERGQRSKQDPPLDDPPEQLFLLPGHFGLCGAELHGLGGAKRILLLFQGCCMFAESDSEYLPV
ncbi:hypothetical protein, partial [Salmonella enterica]|uniref:hypothetical protein n=1 Tax=Salmonella enterica TaxID=28901 RepID=UPI003F4B7925